MLAADIDGLGRHLAEILNHNASALSLRARIYPDAHVHRQLRVGPAIAPPDVIEHTALPSAILASDTSAARPYNDLERGSDSQDSVSASCIHSPRHLSLNTDK